MPSTAKPLRERSSPRREALLDAAGALIFEVGYASTSIDAIIERAGGSKRNVYSAFGSKEGLFAALVDRNASSALASLELGDNDRDLETLLLDFGVRMSELYVSPAVIGIYRTVVAESGRFPELAHRFFHDGPARATQALAAALEQARDNGTIDVDDPHAAADRFVAMMRDNVHLKVVLGIQEPPSDAEIRTGVALAVGIFLNGVRTN